jgi:hypothetical protein
MTRARCKSVRDFPVTATLKGDTATVTTRIGRDVYFRIGVARTEWSTPPGGTIGNPCFDRRQMIRRKMEETGSVDFQADGGETMERIADAHMNVLKDVFRA